jgi:pilus assembly protein Flp/PilA
MVFSRLFAHNPRHAATHLAALRTSLRAQALALPAVVKHVESGATAIEYGLIAAGISVAIIAVVNTLGGQLKNTFSSVSSQLGNAGK